MKIMQCTLVTNNLKQDRHVRWIGKRGVYLKGGESAIVEGAYPTACRSAGVQTDMEHEISTGRASAVIVTNLPVACLEVDGDTKISPAVVRKFMEGKGFQPEPEVQRTTTVSTPEIPVNTIKGQNERFEQKAIDELAPDPGSLFRSEEGDTIQRPITVELFPDGKLIREPGKEAIIFDDEDPMLAAKVAADAAEEKTEGLTEKDAPAEENAEIEDTLVEESSDESGSSAKTTKKRSTRKRKKTE